MDLAAEAIYNADSKIGPAKGFFAKQSLLSHDPNYNERLYTKVAKALVVRIRDYICDIDDQNIMSSTTTSLNSTWQTITPSKSSISEG